MKKVFGIIFAVCLIATMLCVSVFAAEAPASDVVLRVSATTKDGSTVVVKDYTSFEDGWNAAMTLASNPEELNKNEYGRIIVDLYSDWNAVDGEFTDDFFNGKGFDWDAIYIPENVKVTLNLNGHTINRGLTSYQYNGEVICIDENADVIINEGTISGGWSCNGAGGIHVKDGVNITLNNVNFVGNTVEDDNGAAIVLRNATLVMNGGSFSNNVVYNTYAHLIFATHAAGSGVLYMSNSSAVLNDVTFNENVTIHSNIFGSLLAVYGHSDLEMNNCVVENNGFRDEEKDYVIPFSILTVSSSSNLTIKNTVFRNNGNEDHFRNDGQQDHFTGRPEHSESVGSLFSISSASVNVENCSFTGNDVDYLFRVLGAEVTMSDCTITDNTAHVLFAYGTDPVLFKNCTFKNNIYTGVIYHTYFRNYMSDTFHFAVDTPSRIPSLTLEDCIVENATFNTEKYVTFKNSSEHAVGSIFSEGTLTMIISITALVASVAAIGVSVTLNKKKATPAQENDEDE